MGIIKILIVDDYDLFRSGVASIIHRQMGFEVVGEARNGAQALEKASELQPDVVLISTHLSEMHNLGTVQAIKKILPEVKVVLFTDEEETENLWHMVRVGVQGLLSRQIEPEGLCRTLQAVTRGEVAISRNTVTRLVTEFAHLANNGAQADYPVEEPSPRERDILELLTRGASNKEIALSLNISEHTVKSHLKNIMAKFHLENRVQVATYALRFRNSLWQ